MHLYTLSAEDELIFVGANPAADQILGVANGEFLGQTLEEAFPPLAGSELARRYQAVARSGGTWYATELRYEHGEIAGAFDVTAFQIAPGEMVALFRDVTQERRNAAALERYRTSLEELVDQLTREFRLAQEELQRRERLATLGQLTASVAHELRNPLGVLRTAVFSLREVVDRGDPRRLARTLDIAERTITRVDRIIAELLDFTRRRKPLWEETDLDRWLHGLLDERELCPGMCCDRELRSGQVLAVDRLGLRSAVNNLLENAFQALAELEGGEQRVVVGTRVVGDVVEIRVADNGPGIPEELRQRVLEPLFSTKSFGVGLGLSIVKQVVDTHGGTLTIDGANGQGTVIRLCLPVGARRGAGEGSTPTVEEDRPGQVGEPEAEATHRS